MRSELAIRREITKCRNALEKPKMAQAHTSYDMAQHALAWALGWNTIRPSTKAEFTELAEKKFFGKRIRERKGAKR